MNPRRLLLHLTGKMIHDLRFAVRQLLKAPGFTIAAVLVLTLGIGANTAVFSLVHTMLFAPPGYARPNELVQIFSQDTKNPKSFREFSYPTLNDIREQNSVFSGVAGYNVAMVGMGEKNNTRRTFASIVTANYFDVLGVAPVIGRAFTPEEEQPGRAASVVLVSYGYWTRHNRDASVLGSQVLINGRSYTIIGVLPKTFTGTLAVLSPEVWLPLSAFEFITSNYANDPTQTLTSRAGQQLIPIARFKEGVTAPAAEAALKTLATNLERAYPVEQKDQTFITAPLSRFSISDDPPDDSQLTAIAPMLLGMAAVVLLVACLNLANMLLARGTARRKEIAIRLALGGSRWRVVRQLLTEGLLLALLGGAAGLLVGLWASKILALSMRNLLPLDLVWNAGPNLPILAMTFAFCLLGTVAFALGPALKLSRNSVIGDLKEHAGDDVVRRRWRFLPRNPLVVVQIAFSLALLTAAALFIRGANKAAWLETGLHVENDLLLEVDASLGGFEPQRAEQLYRTLNDRLAALPGVQHVSISATAPFGMLSLAKRFSAPGCTWAKMTSRGLPRKDSPSVRATTASAPITSPPWEYRSCAVAVSPYRKRRNRTARRSRSSTKRSRKNFGRTATRSASGFSLPPTPRRGRSAMMAATTWESARAASPTSNRKNRSKWSGSRRSRGPRSFRETASRHHLCAVRARLSEQRLLLHSVLVVEQNNRSRHGGRRASSGARNRSHTCRCFR